MGQKKRRNWASAGGQSSVMPGRDDAESNELLKDVDGRVEDAFERPLDVDASLFIEADRRIQLRRQKQDRGHGGAPTGEYSLGGGGSGGGGSSSLDISVELMEEAEIGLRRQALHEAGFTATQLHALAEEEEMVREREEGIAQVHSDVMEVGAIFRELATVVASQDEGISTIEAETAATAAKAHKSTAALAAASASQRAGRVQYCYLLLVVLIVLMSVVLFFKIISR
jgi:hypothetical protein